MARFCTLASSSAGNSTYIGVSAGSLLVDAGISCRALGRALGEIGADVNDIDAVLVTHEHIDHIRGLRVLTNRRPMTVIGVASVLEFLLEKNCVAPNTKLVAIDDKPVEAAGMLVAAFATSHDCCASVGYRIETPDGHRIAVATDLGTVTGPVEAGMAGCELVLLEANYDPVLLRMGSYPPHLKRRIASMRGHLSNDESGRLAVSLHEQGSTRFVLGHLSRENNNPALAHRTVYDALTHGGAVEGVDFILDVAPYDNPGRLVRL